jgi:hypothetical protein
MESALPLVTASLVCQHGFRQKKDLLKARFERPVAIILIQSFWYVCFFVEAFITKNSPCHVHGLVSRESYMEVLSKDRTSFGLDLLLSYKTLATQTIHHWIKFLFPTFVCLAVGRRGG